MSTEWENDVKSVSKIDKWEGEDSEEEVKDNWDDEDEPSETHIETDVPKVTQISAKKKKLQKIAEKEKEEKEKKLNLKPKTPEEILSEKVERQRLQEESDLILAKEAFGEEVPKSGGSGLDISLNSREDFESFKKCLVDKLLVYDKSPHFVNFLENLFRELCVSIESDDIKRLTGSLTALFNEKVRAQKAGTKGKKKGKGISVRVERNDIESGLGNNDLEEFDDFM